MAYPQKFWTALHLINHFLFECMHPLLKFPESALGVCKNNITEQTPS